MFSLNADFYFKIKSAILSYVFTERIAFFTFKEYLFYWFDSDMVLTLKYKNVAFVFILSHKFELKRSTISSYPRRLAVSMGVSINF